MDKEQAEVQRIIQSSQWLNRIPAVLFVALLVVPAMLGSDLRGDSGAFDRSSSPTNLLKSLRDFYLDPEVSAHGHEVVIDYSSVESFWNTIHQRYQPFYLFIFVYATVALAYLVNGALFGAIEYFGIFFQYKIQPKVHTTRKMLIESLQNYVLNYFGVIVPLVLVFFPFLEVVGIPHKGPFPSWFTVIWQLAASLLLEDFFEYWGHRFLHWQPIYPYVHKVHHHFKAPFALTGSYAHPIETLWLGLATFLPGFILRPHLFTFILWIHLRQFDTAVTHCGYELPYNPFSLLGSFYGGTRFHDYHHTSFNYNYASRFTLIDKLCGTYKEPTVDDSTPVAKGKAKKQ